jgi:hypothetical protein
MKVKHVEVCYLTQPGFIKDRYSSPLQVQHALSTQLLNDSIHVNHTRANGVGEECLRGRKIEG